MKKKSGLISMQLIIAVVLVMFFGMSRAAGRPVAPSQNLPCTINQISGSGTYGELFTLKATLLADTTPLAGKYVQFRINGKWMGFSVTDTSGIAALEQKKPNLGAGTCTGAITVSFLGDETYAACSGTGDLVIGKKEITAIADNKTKLEGTANPPLTFKINGLNKHDKIGGIILATAATTESPAGVYAITVSGPASTTNYNISYTAGLLSVVRTEEIKSVTISGPDSLTMQSNVKKFALRRGCRYYKTTLYKATVLDLNDVALTDIQVTWSLQEPVKGVHINSKRGLVTLTGPAGAGSFTLVASAGGKTASKTVSLTAAAPVAVKSVRIWVPAARIAAGARIRLNAQILPFSAANKAVTWSSSDPNVAEVSSTGIVTGVKPGTTVITVTTADGGFKATCRITVAAAVKKGNDKNQDRSGNRWFTNRVGSFY